MKVFAPMQTAAPLPQFASCLLLMLLLVALGSAIPVSAEQPAADAQATGRAAELSYGGRLYDNH